MQTLQQAPHQGPSGQRCALLECQLFKVAALAQSQGAKRPRARMLLLLLLLLLLLVYSAALLHRAHLTGRLSL